MMEQITKLQQEFERFALDAKREAVEAEDRMVTFFGDDDPESWTHKEWVLAKLHYEDAITRKLVWLKAADMVDGLLSSDDNPDESFDLKGQRMERKSDS